LLAAAPPAPQQEPVADQEHYQKEGCPRCGLSAVQFAIAKDEIGTLSARVAELATELRLAREEIGHSRRLAEAALASARNEALEEAAKIVEREAFPSERARYGVAADAIRDLKSKP
jgi:predicted  nucleic acid-binding Zn-ribbon protein